jgi:predicted NUDIX family phosphoesterase
MGMNKEETESMIWCARTVDVPYLNEAELLTGFKAAWAFGKMSNCGEWRRRGDVEEDTEWRQVIPYTLIQNVNTGLFLASERTNKQGEERLHGRTSLGFGGHIEKSDLGTITVKGSIVDLAAWREIKEETGIVTGTRSFGGIIGVTDPCAEAVHLVHVGVLFHLATTELEFKGEDDKHIRVWRTVDELNERLHYMERWSQIVMQRYLRFIPEDVAIGGSDCEEPPKASREVPRHHHHHHDPAA